MRARPAYRVRTRCTSNPRHSRSSANIPRFLPDRHPLALPARLPTGRYPRLLRPLESLKRDLESLSRDTARCIRGETYGVRITSRKIAVFRIASALQSHAAVRAKVASSKIRPEVHERAKEIPSIFADGYEFVDSDRKCVDRETD